MATKAAKRASIKSVLLEWTPWLEVLNAVQRQKRQAKRKAK